MEQKNGWFAFWQKLMKCLSKQDETGVGDTKSVAPVNTIIQSIKEVSSSKEKDSSKVKSLTESVDTFLKSRYDFRYNVLTEETEYRLLERMEEGFAPVSQRVLNTFCLEAHESGISCWDRDLSRCIFSTRIAEYHPFKLYLEELPVWDGVDRLAALARRVSRDQLWVKEFHIWMRGMTAQWMGVTGSHANSVAPLLISTEQGYFKSTFCKSLLPPALQRYYMDKVDLTSQGHIEQRLAEMGLLNLDEFDTLSPARMQEMVFVVGTNHAVAIIILQLRWEEMADKSTLAFSLCAVEQHQLVVLRFVVDGTCHHSHQPAAEAVFKKSLVCRFHCFCQLADVVCFPVPCLE